MTALAARAVAPSATLRDTWVQQAAWSAAASLAKARLELARSAALGCTVGAALLGTAAAKLAADPGQDTSLRWVAGAGAVLLVAAGLLHSRAASAAHLSAWVRARSASEALKEAVYRCLAHSGPYRHTDGDARLRETALRVIERVRDLQPLVAVITAAPRDPPEVHDLAGYVSQRVDGQIDAYYVPQARTLAQRGNRWRRVQTVVLFAGAALSAVLPYLPGAAGTAWVAVMTTVAGALGAHIEASRFEQLAIGYRATAARLQALRSEWHDSLSKRPLADAESDAFVDRCEDAISVENQAWMAEWAR